MTRLTPSDQAGTGSAPGSATIPPQRSPRSLRLLVLGTGDSAATLRARAADAGAELAQRFSSRVTHVVVDETIGDGDARVARARTAGLPVLSLEEGKELLEAREEIEEAEATVGGEGEKAGGTVELVVPEGEVPAVVSEALDVAVADVEVTDVGVEEERGRKAHGEEQGERAAEQEEGEVRRQAEGVVAASGSGSGADSAAEWESGVGAASEWESGAGSELEVGDEAEPIALIRPRSEYGAQTLEVGPTNVFAGSALEAVLLFPPLPVDESVSPCGCGEICGGEGAEVGGVGGDVAGGDAGGEGEDLGDAGMEAGAAEVIGMRLAEEEEQEDDFGAGVDVAGVMAGDVVLGTDKAGSDCAAQESVRAEAQAPVAAAGSIAWALVPLASLGLLTPVSMGYAAYRLRSRPLAYATAWYTIAVTAAFAVSAVSAAVPRGGGATHSAVSDLLTACLATSWLGGTVHSFLIRRRVF